MVKKMLELIEVDYPGEIGRIEQVVGLSRSNVSGQTLLSGDDCLGIFETEKPRHLLVEAYAGVIQDEDSREKFRLAALVDVTARGRAQREEFARQIRDKDLLLREIQHRVKNNLQLITALIR